MKLSNLNNSLAIFANLGVLVGIIFLVVEINQSNRLAEQDAYDEITATMNSVNIELASNPELAEIARIAATGEPVEEDSAEFHQLRHFSANLFNNWNLVDYTYQLGQLSDEEYPFWVVDVPMSFERWPGIAPHIEYFLRGNSRVSGVSIEEVLETGMQSQGFPANELYLAMIREVLKIE